MNGTRVKILKYKINEMPAKKKTANEMHFKKPANLVADDAVANFFVAGFSP